MNRKAFLIGSPFFENGKNYLPGVTPDIINMKRHLSSLKGGAWDSNEITLFKNPSKNELLKNIRCSCDFAIVQYSGHGYEYSNNGTYLDINPSEIISLNDIHQCIDSPRIYYFIDCCRGVEYEIVTEMRKSVSLSSSYDLNQRNYYRNKYYSIIASCELGYSIIYSCSMNESAGEDNQGRGGIFSYSYFCSANSISRVPEDRYYGINDIFEKAKSYMSTHYPMDARTQHPTMRPERRNRHFPFLI
jgi:hypothetical protein